MHKSSLGTTRGKIIIPHLIQGTANFASIASANSLSIEIAERRSKVIIGSSDDLDDEFYSNVDGVDDEGMEALSATAFDTWHFKFTTEAVPAMRTLLNQHLQQNAVCDDATAEGSTSTSWRSRNESGSGSFSRTWVV